MQEFANNAALRDFMMDHSIVIAGLRHGLMRIEIEGGSTYELRNASIPSFEPQTNFDYIKATRLPLVYRVSGGELLKI